MRRGNKGHNKIRFDDPKGVKHGRIVSVALGGGGFSVFIPVNDYVDTGEDWSCL